MTTPAEERETLPPAGLVYTHCFELMRELVSGIRSVRSPLKEVHYTGNSLVFVVEYAPPTTEETREYVVEITKR